MLQQNYEGFSAASRLLSIVSEQKLVYTSSGLSVQLDFNMIQFYSGLGGRGVCVLQCPVENLVMTKIICVHTPKTTGKTDRGWVGKDFIVLGFGFLTDGRLE